MCHNFETKWRHQKENPTYGMFVSTGPALLVDVPRDKNITGMLSLLELK